MNHLKIMNVIIRMRSDGNHISAVAFETFGERPTQSQNPKPHDKQSEQNASAATPPHTQKLSNRAHTETTK